MNFQLSFKNVLIVSALVVNCSAKVMQIKEHHMHVPSKLGKISLFHDKKGFFVRKDDKVTPIQNCDVPKELRNISSKQLKKILGGDESLKVVKLTKEQVEKILKDKDTVILEGKAAKKFAKKLSKKIASQYLVVKQFDNGEYKLELSPRLLGGGIFGGQAGFWAGKFLTHLAAQGAMLVVAGAVSVVATPAVGGAFLIAMEKTAAIPVEIASNHIGLATGIAGAVATGPV